MLLYVITLCVSLVMGNNDRIDSSQVRRQAQAIARITKNGGVVGTIKTGGRGPTEGGLYVRLIGPGITNTELKDLAGLRDVRVLCLADTNISDAGLREIAKHKNLVFLNLNDTSITDDGLESLVESNI